MALVLTRRLGEKLVIDNKIIVTVERISPNAALFSVENTNTSDIYIDKLEWIRGGEKLDITPEIFICLKQINCGQAKLAIIAPRSVSVHRQEIQDRIERETRPAMLSKQAI